MRQVDDRRYAGEDACESGPVERRRGTKNAGTPATHTRYATMAESTAKSVLVVEDEAFTRMVAVDAISDMGLTSYEAGDAAEALEVLDGHPEVSLIFTDVNMPGDMDGIDLVKEAHKLRPDLSILVTSGATTVADNELPDGGTFLPKPYGSQQLVDAVKSKLCE